MMVDGWRFRAMRPNQQTLGRIRAYILVGVGVFVLLAYLLSRKVWLLPNLTTTWHLPRWISSSPMWRGCRLTRVRSHSARKAFSARRPLPQLTPWRTAAWVVGIDWQSTPICCHNR